ncbi:hypothetical protein [Solibacillus sp. FSL W7-1324]|uniref:hypothetical protein n=1 Tax=Solibacillus sp. FSL W7-1324 TaxID=2921701 RepID=UPI0030F6E2E9
MKVKTNEMQDRNKIVQKLILSVAIEFIPTVIILSAIDALFYYWGDSMAIPYTSNIDLNFIYLMKAFIIALLLGRLTLTFNEYRETRVVLFNPEKDLNLNVSFKQYIALHVCILPLAYVIATYTMFANSVLSFIILIAAVYIVSAARAVLDITSDFYQKLLLTYYNDQEVKEN